MVLLEVKTLDLLQRKIFSPQRHRGHREKPCISNCATGAVTK
jgi:hypothetical protein